MGFPKQLETSSLRRDSKKERRNPIFLFDYKLILPWQYGIQWNAIPGVLFQSLSIKFNRVTLSSKLPGRHLQCLDDVNILKT